jgi:SAM-dependent methyltransferase/predicted nucleotidyltransferase
VSDDGTRASRLTLLFVIDETRHHEVQAVLARLARWAEQRDDVRALALVGSWASGSPRPDSDVDIVLLTDMPQAYVDHDGWVAEVGGTGSVVTRDWGAITERRFTLPSGLEIELGVGLPTWASITPVDRGTRRVVCDGMRALYDPEGRLRALARACAENDDGRTVAGRRGGAFYDHPEVLERYRSRHAALSDPTEVMEEPALLAELGDVEGARIVDLGCGDAAIGRRLLDAGCRSYLGIDGSANMVQAATETLDGTAGRVIQGDIEEFTAPPNSVDLVISRLALHYVDDVAAVFRACRRCLTPGGRIVFTVVHPVMTSHDARESAEQVRTDWRVDDYFAGGPRPQKWLGAMVTWHHRTIEDYVTTLQRAGFDISALRECRPVPENFNDVSEYARRRRIPMFLLLAGAAR